MSAAAQAGKAEIILCQQPRWVPAQKGHGVERPDATLVERCADIAHLLWVVRRNLSATREPGLRLAMMDLSTRMESVVFKLASEWSPTTLRELLQKNYILAKAAAGAGFLEVWEWELLEPFIYPVHTQESLGVEPFLERVKSSLRAVE